MNTRHILRVALVDDHILFRDGLRLMLEADASMQVVAQAATSEEAEDLWKHGPAIDLALIDYQLESQEGRSGLDVLRLLRRMRPQVKAVMLTGHLPAEVFAETVKVLQASVFLKSEPLDELRSIVERTLQGQVAVSQKAALGLLNRPEKPDAPAQTRMSDRELLVLRMITEGKTNKEIASHLNTTETNVKAILQRLFFKTGVRSRAQLVRYVFEFDIDLI